MKRLMIYNGKVLTPFKIIENGYVMIENNRIVHVGQGDIDYDDCERIDANRKYIAPGFIDIHSHGGGGFDFMDATEEAYLGAARIHALHGTTSMVPTTLTSTKEHLYKVIDVYKNIKGSCLFGAELLGLHLEGPYFSMLMKGAQDSRYIHMPDPVEYQEILSASSDIIRWSAAPELPGAIDFGRYISKRGVLPSIAHSDAVYEQVLEAFENGFTHITHLYSAMSGVKRVNAYRYAGVIESAYLIDDITVEIIADGHHLPGSLLKLVYKIKGPSHIAMVTDSMRGAGMPDGESILGSIQDGQKVLIENGVAKIPDRSAFAGSVATTDHLVRTMIKTVGVPMIEAVQMMTSTPARIIGVFHERGSIIPGKRADIIIFDDNINVQATIINGKRIQ